MKINYKILFFFLSINALCFAQQTPLDFDDSSDVFIGFFGSSFSVRADPQDTNNTVAQFVNNGSNTTQGLYIDLNQPIDLDVQKNITLSFYSFDANSHNIVVKLENGANPDIEVRVTITSPAANNWKDLTFDFSNAEYSSNGASVNATGAYSRLTIFIDKGVTTAGTYLLDDINDGSVAGDPHELDVIYDDLVWSDEFNTDGAVNSANWHHQTIGIVNGGWANGELQHYTNSQTNSFVSGGFLNIVAKKETINQNGVSRNYTSARLNSKFAFTYGRVDVRAKLPFGNGTWPAIWTLGKNVSEPGAYWQTQDFGTTSWPACGEIDIMEHGLGALNHVSSALHTPSSFGNTVNVQSFTLNDVANDYHVYSMNWSPNQITFLIDGVGFYTYNPAVKNSSTWPFDLEQFLLLNVAMGGFAGTPDAGFTQSSMVIDYVKVYQNSTASIDDVFASKFSIYPNPSSEVINIRTDEIVDKTELYNTLGQLIINKNGNTKLLKINMVKSGLYLLKIYSGNKIATKKVIVN